MPKKVAVLMGSDSDLETMQAGVDVLEDLGIECEVRIMSAHRTPADVTRFVKGASVKEIGVIVAGAGLAAHLAGVVAAHTRLPVIGVPMQAGGLQGLDALLSTVQMPPGIPVGTVAIGKVGAKNAAWMAARILALSDEALAKRLDKAMKAMSSDVRAKDRKLQKERKKNGKKS